jgi:Rieske Fe-S protein
MIRREFLKEALNRILGLWTVIIGIGLGFIGLISLLINERAIDFSGGERVMIRLSEITEGNVKKIFLRNRAVIVINSRGKIHALSAICTHLGCMVNWSEEQKQIICPCHGAVFNLNGNVLTGPAIKPLMTYNVELVEDDILVG